MSRSPRLVLGCVAAVLIATIFAIFAAFKRNTEIVVSERAVFPAESATKPEPSMSTETVPIRRGDTFAELLARAGAEAAAAQQITDVVQKAFDVRRLRAGSELRVTRSDTGMLHSLEYLVDSDHALTISHSDGVFAAEILDVPARVTTVPVCSKLEGSLFESIEKTGERPELAIQMAEIFAWDLDFYTDPREGDEFCVLVEKKEYSNGQPPTYGRILAAKYVNEGKLYDAFLFGDDNGKPRFYSYDGRSLQAAFLRSPMKFEARVSSRFSHRRFHPVLKRFRPHLGTDYAAPTGTPVQAVAAGRVAFSGRSGGGGNVVRIAHANGYETYYMHLSRRYVRAGQRVEQGQRIGAVGATGLATGPHLDFRIRRNGKFVDFERLRPPRATTISAAHSAEFAAARNEYRRLMEAGTPSDVPALAMTQVAGGSQ